MSGRLETPSIMIKPGRMMAATGEGLVCVPRPARSRKTGRRVAAAVPRVAQSFPPDAKYHFAARSFFVSLQPAEPSATSFWRTKIEFAVAALISFSGVSV